MKYLFVLMISFILTEQYAISQNTYGIKVGLNLSNQKKTFSTPQNPSTQTQDTKELLGFQFGAFYKIKMNEKLVFSTEVIFSEIGSKTPYTTEQQVLNPDGIQHYFNDKMGYIEIPLSLQYILNKLYFGIGPSISFKVFSKIKNFETQVYNTTYYKTLDAAANILAGYKFSEKIDLNLRYSYGLLNIHEDHNYVTTKNRFLNLSFLYSLK